MSKKIAYYYNESLGNFCYGINHPMKPLRVKITDIMLQNYNIKSKLFSINPSYYEDVTDNVDFSKFHSDEYLNFLKNITPETSDLVREELNFYNLGDDCPVFDSIYDYCKIYTTGSILGAHLLNTKSSQIAINWSGGLHHAKKSQASGFCYINDCVLAILELLQVHQRVLYIDIDVHHGDGVEEAFFTTDRVMTLSFHKYGDYFPGTGALFDKGTGKGLNHSINIPYLEGMEDNLYVMMFKTVFDEVLDKFRPEAIVMQCGADSLCGDRLGCFNLSIKGHGACVEYVKNSNIPTLVLGGGGYTLRNVPRCWAYETGKILGEELDNKIPNCEYSEYFHPEYNLHIPISNMENQNSIEYLNYILENIQYFLKDLIRYNGESSVGTFDDKEKTTVVNKDVFNKDEITMNNPDICLDNHDDSQMKEI